MPHIPPHIPNTLNGAKRLVDIIRRNGSLSQELGSMSRMLEVAFIKPEYTTDLDERDDIVAGALRCAPSNHRDINNIKYADTLSVLKIFPVIDIYIGLYAYLTGKGAEYDLDKLLSEIQDSNYSDLDGYGSIYTHLNSEDIKNLLVEMRGKNYTQLKEMLPKIQAMFKIGQEPTSEDSKAYESLPDEMARDAITLGQKYNMPSAQMEQFLNQIAQCRVTESNVTQFLPKCFALGNTHDNRPTTAVIMPKTNPSGFFMGRATNSCMSVGGHSEGEIVKSVYTSPWCDYFVIYKRTPEGGRTNHGNIVGASYVWMSADENNNPDGLVVNSYESGESGFKDFFPFMKGLMQHCIERGLKLYLGHVASQTPNFTIRADDQEVRYLALETRSRPAAMDPQTAQYYDTYNVVQIPLEMFKGREFTVQADNTVEDFAQGLIREYICGSDIDIERLYHNMSKKEICALASHYHLEPRDVMQRIAEFYQKYEIDKSRYHYSAACFIQISKIFSDKELKYDSDRYTREQFKKMCQIIYSTSNATSFTAELLETMAQIVYFVGDDILNKSRPTDDGCLNLCEYIATRLQQSKIQINSENSESVRKIAKVCFEYSLDLHAPDVATFKKIFEIAEFFEDNRQLWHLPIVAEKLIKAEIEITAENSESVRKIAKIYLEPSLDVATFKKMFEIARFFEDDQLRHLPIVAEKLTKAGIEITAENSESVPADLSEHIVALIGHCEDS